MPRLFHGNFDFEHELSGQPASSSNQLLKEINRELSSCWQMIADPEDRVLLPAPFPKHASIAGSPGNLNATCREILHSDKNWTFIPWGWSESSRKLALSLGLETNAPDPKVVRAVNSRCYRWRLEEELGIQLPGSCISGDLPELQKAVGKLATNPEWVIKAEFGMSGRERILGRGNRIPESVANWAKKHWSIGQQLVLEPWLSRTQEAGLQFEIPPRGASEFLGVTQLLAEKTGVYRGSRFGLFDDQKKWEPCIETGHKIAARLQKDGYFGPLGIDVMEYRSASGELRLRHFQDLNARLTMGRLALESKTRLNPLECGSWIHFRSLKNSGKKFSLEDLDFTSSPDWPAGARIVTRSVPETGLFQWILIAAESSQIRLQAESIVEKAMSA